MSITLAAGFMLAAAAIAAVRASTPFEHGWWLVAYLFLVGGVAQLLVVTGRARLAARLGAPHPAPAWLWSELTLWNLGALAVPVGVLTSTEPPIVLGSILLLVALGLFTVGLRRLSRRTTRRAPGWELAYYALAGSLAGSVFVGTGLAGALPGQ